MAVQVMIDPAERGHLLGDVPALGGNCSWSSNATRSSASD